MGFWISYVATTASEDRILDVLGLQIVDHETAMPDGKWWLAQLVETGWFVLWSEDVGFVDDSSSKLTELSKAGEVWGCAVGEGSNWAQAEYFEKGVSKWSIKWDGSKGVKETSNLYLEGRVPAEIKAKLQDVLSKQEQNQSVDLIFDLPFNLASEDCGFRYDDFLEDEQIDKFRIVSVAAKRPVGGFWSRLFGSRR